MAHKASGWLAAILAAALLAGPIPARGDELDPLLVDKEARPLRESWEECVAAFARTRLGTRQSAEAIAATAFRRCRSREAKLRDLLAKRVGRRQAGTVILLLREQYTAGLAEAIRELRRQD